MPEKDGSDAETLSLKITKVYYKNHLIIKTDSKTVNSAILHVKHDALQTFKPIMIQANQRNYSH